jgi:hypothetical protein
MSIVQGAASGPAPSVVAFIRPKNAPALTLPSLIGRNHQRFGMFWEANRSEAARSSVRLLHATSFEQSAAYRPICSSVVFSSQTKWPGGLTPSITDRWMLLG